MRPADKKKMNDREGAARGDGVYLKEDERLDDLNRNGLKIIQNKRKFCFGMDAVLLSGFADVKKGENALDLCTGGGIIPILLSAKTWGEHFTGVEIQDDIADMARRSVELNGLDEKISVITGDIKDMPERLGAASFDVITVNPPYIAGPGGLKNPDMSLAIARHEIKCTLEDVVRVSEKLLKPGGRMYMVHRPERLSEIISALSAHRIEAKRLKFVHPFIDREANMVLIEAVRGAGRMTRVEKPLIIYREQGVYSDEIHDIYGY